MSKKKVAQVFHFDLYGKREDKYDFLNQNSINSIKWTEINPDDEYAFFVPKNFDEKENYDKGFKISEIFIKYSAGIETNRDAITIHYTQKELETVLNDFLILDKYDIVNKYKTDDARDWQINRAKNDVIENISDNKFTRNISYRLFDNRFTFYTGKQNGFVCNGRYNVMKHLLQDNIALISTRILSSNSFNHIFLSNIIGERCYISNKGKEANYYFPLYLYPTSTENNVDLPKKHPNLNIDIIEKISIGLGLKFVSDDSVGTGRDLSLRGDQSLRDGNEFAPIDILDYIYAVLHSPTYREKYKEFLKIDFPRVPYPKDKDTFWQLVKLGGELRQIHLLKSPIVENYITQYHEDGNNMVEKIRAVPVGTGRDLSLRDDLSLRGDLSIRVFINDTQYFDNVPEVAWNFYIGGYQPAQKWLKDRKERKLEFDDILHYQKIIVSLTETDRLMKEIDKIELE